MGMKPCKMLDVAQLSSLLKTSEVFSDLDEQNIENLHTMLEYYEAEAGDCVRQVGEESSSLYIIASGSVQLRDPVRRVTVGRLSAGKAFGLLSVLFPGVSYIEAYAESSATFVVLDEGSLRMLEVSNPQLAVYVLRSIRRSLNGVIGAVIPVLARLCTESE